MSHLDLFENDDQFAAIINSHEKADPEELTIVDDQFSEQIKIFYHLKFTMTSWTNVIHYFNSNKMCHKLYGIIGLKQHLSCENPEINQSIEIIHPSTIIQLINYMKQTQHPQLQLQGVRAIKNILLMGWNKIKDLLTQPDILAIVELLNNPISSIPQSSLMIIQILGQRSTTFNKLMLNNNCIQNLINLIQQNLHHSKILKYSLRRLVFGFLSFRSAQEYELIKNGLIFVCQYIAKSQQHIETLEFMQICRCIQEHSLVILELEASLIKKIMLKIMNIINMNFQGFEDQPEEQSSQQFVNEMKLQFKNEIKLQFKQNGIKLIESMIRIKQENKIFFISNSGLNFIHLNLSSEDLEIRRLSCLVLETIVYWTVDKIEDIFINPNMLPHILDMFKNDDPIIRLQIGYFLAGLSLVKELIPVYMLFKQQNVLEYYLSLLDGCYIRITTGFSCISQVLMVGQKVKENEVNYFAQEMKKNGGYQRLLELENHTNNELSLLAKEILEVYFVDDENLFSDMQSAAGVI